MNIRALFKTLAILAMVLIGSTGLYARGTPNATWITNAKTGGPVDIRLATNAGQLSANFVNASSVTNFATLIGTVATTKVTQGFDMSVMLLTTLATQTVSAGGMAIFTMFVTNWGNSSSRIGAGLTNIGKTTGWSNEKYIIKVNSATVWSNSPTLNPGGTNTVIPAGVFRFDVLVRVPSWMPDGSTNTFRLRTGNLGLPTMFVGDNWPGPLAIAPSTTDTNILGGNRDWQQRYCVVRVSGPILRLSKSVNVSFLKPYEQMTYTIFYTNAGTATAQSVVIQDVMPSFTTNLVNGIVLTNVAVSNAIIPTIIGKRVQFTPPGVNVAAGKWGRIRFTVQVK